MQAPCLIPTAELPSRQVKGLLVACIGVFIYLFTLNYFDYMRCVQQTKYVDWDIKTITAGDYTVEFNLNTQFYEKFIESYHDPSNPISEVMQLKLFLKDEIEKRLTEMPALGLDGPEGDAAPVKIALLTFAFDNAQIIYWLTRRG